ncbi:MAG: hypothetical protein ACODAG_09345, partial [Myxococcota bacterium]
VQVDQLSPRYTEDDVRQLFHCQPLPDGHTGWIEMRMDARDGDTRRRRFVVQGTPERREGRFDWRVELLEADSARTREGQLRRVGP